MNRTAAVSSIFGCRLRRFVGGQQRSLRKIGGRGQFGHLAIVGQQRGVPAGLRRPAR